MDDNLKKSYKTLSKISTLMGKDLYYSVQVGMDADKGRNVVQWAGYVSAPSDGLSPITFLSNDYKEFQEILETFLNEEINEEQVLRAYYDAKIISKKQSIKEYTRKIKDLG